MDIIKKYLDKDWNWKAISENNMENGKKLWIKKKVKETIIIRKVSYRILCNKLDSDISTLIVNNIM